MEASYQEIAIVIGVVMALFKLLEKGIELLGKQFSKGKVDNQQQIDIALLKSDVHKILTNDLVHNEACHQRLESKMQSMSEDLAVIKNEILKK